MCKVNKVLQKKTKLYINWVVIGKLGFVGVNGKQKCIPLSDPFGAFTEQRILSIHQQHPEHPDTSEVPVVLPTPKERGPQVSVFFVGFKRPTKTKKRIKHNDLFLFKGVFEWFVDGLFVVISSFLGVSVGFIVIFTRELPVPTLS